MDPNALFKQYESEYCNKSTEISKKIGAVSTLSGGRCARLVSRLVSSCLGAEGGWQHTHLRVHSVSQCRHHYGLMPLMTYYSCRHAETEGDRSRSGFEGC